MAMKNVRQQYISLRSPRINKHFAEWLVAEYVYWRKRPEEKSHFERFLSKDIAIMKISKMSVFYCSFIIYLVHGTWWRGYWELQARTQIYFLHFYDRGWAIILLERRWKMCAKCAIKYFMHVWLLVNVKTFFESLNSILVF